MRNTTEGFGMADVPGADLSNRSPTTEIMNTIPQQRPRQRTNPVHPNTIGAMASVDIISLIPAGYNRWE
jgi:hypothetical protein